MQTLFLSLSGRNFKTDVQMLGFLLRKVQQRGAGEPPILLDHSVSRKTEDCLQESRCISELNTGTVATQILLSHLLPLSRACAHFLLGEAEGRESLRIAITNCLLGPQRLGTDTVPASSSTSSVMATGPQSTATKAVVGPAEVGCAVRCAKQCR